jgi:hypothetical protein
VRGAAFVAVEQGGARSWVYMGLYRRTQLLQACYCKPSTHRFGRSRLVGEEGF